MNSKSLFSTWALPLLVLCPQALAAPKPSPSPPAQAPLTSRIKSAELSRDASDPSLKEGAESLDSKVRAFTALALGRIQKPEAIEPLKKLALDPDSKVAAEAIFALGQLGWVEHGTARKEEELARWILSKLVPMQAAVPLKIDPALWIEAAGKLSLSKASELLTPYLDDPRAEVRGAACLGIYRGRLNLQMRGIPVADLPTIPEATLLKMHSLLNGTSPRVTKECLYSLVRSRAAVPATEAKRLLTSTDFDTRFFAIVSLGRSGAEQGGVLLRHLKRLKKNEWKERLVALDALKEAKSEALLASDSDLLDSLTSDSSAHVRNALASLIGQNDSLPVSIAMKLASDPSDTVKASALRSLIARMPEQTEKLLRSKLSSKAWIEREAIAQAIAKELEKPEPTAWAVEFNTTLLQDSSILVRNAALTNLGKLKSPESLVALLGSLSSSESLTRSTAVEALKLRPKSENKAILRAMREAVLASGADPKWEDFRAESVKVLKERGDSEGLTLPKTEPVFSPHGLASGKNPRIQLETNRGKILIELFSDQTPHQVAAIVAEAKKGRYDGLLFHRVVPNFVVQGLDPEGSGGGYSGYNVRSEAHRGPFLRGSVGMPRSQDFDSGGIQLFINHVDTPHLEGLYTVLGRVVQGLDVVDKIERGDQVRKAKVL